MSDDQEHPVSEKIKPRLHAGGSGETVTVACKLPNGLILHIDDMVDYQQPFTGGYLNTKRAIARPEKYTLNGFSIDLQALKENQGIDKIVVSGYALTSGIPKEFWDAWFEQNKDSDLVKNRIVFAQPTEQRTRAEAKENAKTRSGLEPIDPANVADRMPGSRFRITASTDL